jgi:oligopeptide/dipeptide ABC transporter ATP-binding protein
VPLLSVKGLSTHFFTEEGTVRAVDGISFQVGRGEVLGIVGESGSGKSVTSLSLLRLVPDPPGRIVAGEMILEDEKGRALDLVKASEDQMRAVRGDRIAMIFQDPMTSLNPYLRVSEQLVEVLEIHKKMRRAEARKRCVEMLEAVGIPAAASRIDDYPHQLSGGMRQRVMIAMALLCDPDLLIADEPTTALDVTVQAQILELIAERKEALGLGVILITHDLGVIAKMADRVLVMYAGKIVEEGLVDSIFENPRHPYTIGLARSIPRIDDPRGGELAPIPGMPPSLARLPPGCPFHPRCAHADPGVQGALSGDTPHRRGRGRAPGALSRRGGVARREPKGGLMSEGAAPAAPPGAGSGRAFPGAAGPAPAAGGHGEGRRRRLLRRGQGLHARPRGRVGLWQVNDGAGPAPPGGAHVGQRSARWSRALLAPPASCARRAQMQMIFQDPYASLNPRMTILDTLAEPLFLHGLVKSEREALSEVAR